ncbi:hypothetical protein CB1_000265064 [Camelus ferus]|nr:hypothetical protein CB1_000265064 [Camelus ferus]
MEPLMGTNCEEKQSFLQLPETLAELRTRLVDMGLSFINQLLLKGDSASWKPMPLSGRMLGCESTLSKAPPSSPGIKMNSYEVLPPAVDRKTLLKCYCNLNFDPATASEELFLFKETHSGCHYWEAEVSNSWVCLGVTYRRSPSLSGRPRRNIVYLLGRNPYSWCLEWDSLKFSVWHNNTQTVLHGGYHRTLGVALGSRQLGMSRATTGCGAGCLFFYGVAGGVSLIYRFLAAFLEPLYPAVMVSSGASVTLKQHPEGEA